MIDIKDFWHHQESPFVNGVVYPDGVIQLHKVNVDWGPPVRYSIEVGCKTSMLALEEAGGLNWNDCAVLSQLCVKDKNVEIIAGESDYGSDGFVAVVNATNHELIWLAFFNCSNPFDQLQMHGDELWAWSTSGCVWRFPICSPDKVVVE